MVRKILIFLFLCSITVGQTKIANKEAYALDFGEPNSLRVTIGDTTFKAKVDFKIWDEDNITLEYVGITTKPTLVDGKLTLDTPALGMDWQKVGKELKWLFRLKSKPPNSKYSLNLGGNWRDFDFFYQKPLSTSDVPGSNLEYLKMDGVDHVRLNYPAGGAITFEQRPLYIDGSYAVYHKTKRDYILGQKNYKIGKAFHIHVPKAIDADNKTFWRILNIEDGIYSVTIPDEAVYPVTINDTFGFTSQGDSSTGFNPDFVMASGPFAPAGAGNATSVSWYFTNVDTAPMTFGFYNETSSLPDVLQADSAGATENTDGWITQDLDSSTAVTVQNYWIASNRDTDNVTIWYDSAGSETMWYKAQAYSGGTLVDPFPGSLTQFDNKMSCYVTYTPTAAGVVLFRRRIEN